MSYQEVTVDILDVRAQEVAKLASEIQVVGELMTSLSHLVHEQSPLIDNLETNVESSLRDTSRGEQELLIANKKQKQYRSNTCCLLLACLVFTSVLVGIVLLLTTSTVMK